MSSPSTYFNCTLSPPPLVPAAIDPNIGLAFLLVTIAGLSTAIGSGLACCMRAEYIHYLSISLSLSAGVMIYVSLVEIFAVKAVDALSVDNPRHGYSIATALFFLGIFMTAAFDWAGHAVMENCSGQREQIQRRRKRRLRGREKEDDDENSHNSRISQISQTIEIIRFHDELSLSKHKHDSPLAASSTSTSGPSPSPTAALDAAAAEWTAPCMCMEELDEIIRREETRRSKANQEDTTRKQMEDGLEAGHSHGHGHGHAHGHGADGADQSPATDHSHLQGMGIMTGVALALHNFPEGLVTFVGALADESVGIALAIAIALHNIPEGICVSMPIFYATNNRYKAFFFSLLSGLTEPVGAAIGYFVLRDYFSPTVYGVLFSLVAGMMIYIAFKELLPTARHYDPKDRYVSKSLFAGMAAMAVSLSLFSSI